MTSKQVFIGIIGLGGVGKAFLSQLDILIKRMEGSISIKMNLVLVARSRKILYNSDYTPIVIADAESKLAVSTQELLSMAKVMAFLAATPGKAILVDNTSSQDVADEYPDFLYNGISIITPNKKAFSGPYTLWQDIQKATKESGAKIFHESSVGAGLPVLSTLQELLDTGDKVLKIEGVFSGTMSFLFNSFAPTEGQGGKWSAEVKKAKDLGYTEPDPRDDLNGLDVARKLTILARIVGLPIESPTSFPVQSLIPKELESCKSGDEFMTRLHEFDSQMDDMKSAAEKEGKVVRFVGSIDVVNKKVSVGLEKFDRSHPIAALKGSDNIISFTTKRYTSPLIIQGAGAGAEVTAAGTLGDLIRIMQRTF